MGDQHRTSIGCYDETASLLLEHRDSPGTVYRRERGLNRFEEVATQLNLILDEVAEHLAVNIGFEAMPGNTQGLLQLVRIRHYPVVDKAYLAFAVIVGIGGGSRHTALDSPPGMPDAHCAQPDLGGVVD
jgi:hypothetical protein